MIKYETNIDTVAIQLDFYNSYDQSKKFKLLKQWIISRQLGKLEFDIKNNSENVQKHNLFYGKSKLATLHTGYTKVKDKLNAGYIPKFYIRIRFAGLKSYKKQFDIASFNCLMNVCGLLRANEIPYRLVELDIAIDMYCNFNNVLVVCTRKSANVKYNGLGLIQYYSDAPTTYIEDYSDIEQRKKAVLRAYLYNKTAKEKLDFTVTRFELKLQNRFFLKNKFDAETIINALDRYYVMHFRSRGEKQFKIVKYNSYRKVTPREIHKLGFDNYRLYPDITVIKEFIRQIESVYIGSNGDFIIPPKETDDFENIFLATSF